MTSGATAGVLLVSDFDGGVLTLQIHRPEVRNALSSQVFAALRAALKSAAADPQVRAVVLCGHGKHFAAGSDIGELSAHDAVSIQVDGREDIWREIAAFPKPLIGAVAGYCFGGGCELAMNCDILVALKERALRPAQAGTDHDHVLVVVFVHRGSPTKELNR